MKQVNYFTMLKPETKQLLDALGRSFKGQRELIEDMVKVYMEARPERAAMAAEYMRMAEGEK